MSQLRMAFIADGTLPEIPEIPQGYTLRTYKPEDLDSYCRLRIAAGFSEWNATAFANYASCLIPNGLMVVEAPDGELAASASAEINTKTLWPYNGNLGWVACNPEHRGKKLGKAVVAAAMRRLLLYGFKRISLSTDDYRIPALATYLKLGWIPYITEPDMPERWNAIAKTLSMEINTFAPQLPQNGPDGF